MSLLLGDGSFLSLALLLEKNKVFLDFLKERKEVIDIVQRKGLVINVQKVLLLMSIAFVLQNDLQDVFNLILQFC